MKVAVVFLIFFASLWPDLIETDNTDFSSSGEIISISLLAIIMAFEETVSNLSIGNKTCSTAKKRQAPEKEIRIIFKRSRNDSWDMVMKGGEAAERDYQYE